MVKPLLKNEIENRLISKFIGKKVYLFDSVSSTNVIAEEMAQKDVEEGTIVIAEEQTQGRGRMDRKWFSPRGGIYLSIILRPSIPPSYSSQITMIAALSVVRTIKGLTHLGPIIKWPNDILLSGRKTSGILTQVSSKEDWIDYAVVGIGVNINIQKDEFPKGIPRPVTSLKIEAGYDVNRSIFLCRLLENFETFYLHLNQRKDYELIKKEWLKSSQIIGKRIVVLQGDQVVEGEVIDASILGALKIRQKDGIIKEVKSGTVISE